MFQLATIGDGVTDVDSVDGVIYDIVTTVVLPRSQVETAISIIGLA